MSTRETTATEPGRRPAGVAEEGARRRLLEGCGVSERCLEAGGIPTVVLEGGEGPPIVLLHGPGVSAAGWLLVFPELVRRYRVVAPDLPGHGGSGGDNVDAPRLLDWLSALIAETCDAPPTIVGHVLGGAIAARFAIERGEEAGGLVLVDSLGLGRFLPSPRFAIALLGFQARPTERSYERLMRQCAYDLEGVRGRMGARWEPFVDHNLDLARSPGARTAGRMMREFGLPRIPAEALARISVPTTLVWGRQDRANRLRLARVVSERLGWPLRVIEDCADDPALDQPEAFVDAVNDAVGRARVGEGLSA